MLSSFYLLALGGVGITILAVLIGAIVNVSRKPVWATAYPTHSDRRFAAPARIDSDHPSPQEKTPRPSGQIEAKIREPEQVV